MTRVKKTTANQVPSNPLVSVIVPVYNAEKFIQKCLEHLIHQSYDNLEIIIVDDGSTDNSVDICRQYAQIDKRIKIIRQNNAGPSAASNTGFDAAHGTLVHFHDHDDFVNLDYFEHMVDAAIKTNADILCGEVNQPDYQYPEFQSIEICVSLADKINKTRANDFNPAWRYVYKREFLERIGLRFEESLFGNQDIYFTKPAIIMAKTVATVPGAIYNVADTPTALGKSMKRRPNNNPRPGANVAYKRYDNLLKKYNARQLMRKTNAPHHVSKIKVLNRTLFRRDIWPNKVRYYLFGINIATKYLK